MAHCKYLNKPNTRNLSLKYIRLQLALQHEKLKAYS